MSVIYGVTYSRLLGKFMEKWIDGSKVIEAVINFPPKFHFWATLEYFHVASI
jgi:hypothetical protein